MTRKPIADLVEKPISGEWGIEPTNGHSIGVIRNANFTNEGVMDLSDIAYREIPEKKIVQKKLKYGDIIMEKSGGSPTQPVGRVVYYDRPDGELMHSNFTAALRPKQGVDSRFLYYMLWATHLFKTTWAYQNKTTGIANLQLTRYLNEVEVPCPPLPTQRRIAAILDKAQALVANDRRTLAVYDQLAKSLFLEMFGDPVRNERGWESQKLDDLCASIVVGFVGACEQFYTGPEGVPMVRTGNLREGTLDFANLKYVTREFHLKQRKSQLRNGDILIARHGDNGKASLYDGRFLEANSLNIVVLRPNVKKMFPDFLINVLNFPTMRTFIASRTGGATQKVVNTKEIQRLEFIVPPLVDQKRFAEKLFQINIQLTQAATSLRRSEALFGSLLQGAFAGELGG